jgi:hypothetical protein
MKFQDIDNTEIPDHLIVSARVDTDLSQLILVRAFLDGATSVQTLFYPEGQAIHKDHAEVTALLNKRSELPPGRKPESVSFETTTNDPEIKTISVINKMFNLYLDGDKEAQIRCLRYMLTRVQEGG